jgi:tetratricopeptide (TPR) repeat protein
MPSDAPPPSVQTPFYRTAWFYAALVSGAAYIMLLFFWNHAWAWKLLCLLAVMAFAAGIVNWFRAENRYFRVGVWLLAAGAVSGAPTIAAWAKAPSAEAGFLIDASPWVAVALIAAGCLLILLDFFFSEPDTKKHSFVGLVAGLFGIAVVVFARWLGLGSSNQPINHVEVSGDVTISGNGGNIVNSTVMGADRQELEEFRKLFERQLAAKDEQIAAKDGQLDIALRAVERLRQQASSGDRDAANAISETRKSGDTSALLEVLIAERDHGFAKQTELNREIAAIAYLRGDIDTADRAVKALFRENPNDLVALNLRGHIRRLRGDYLGAEADYKRIASLGKGNPIAISTMLVNLSLIYQSQGDLTKAEEMLLKTLAIGEKTGFREGMASAYGNLGAIYMTRGDLTKAEETLRETLAISKELGHREGMASAYGNFGLIYMKRGDLEKAEEMYCKALEIEEELGRREGMAIAYGNLGLLYRTRGKLEESEEMHRKALAINEELGCREGIAIAYGNLGSIFFTRGELEKAEEMYRKALAISKELGHREGVAVGYGNLGAIYRTRGELAEAEEMHRKALVIEEKLGRHVGIADGYINLGVIYHKRGELGKAEEMYRKALAINEELGRREGVAFSHANLGVIYEARVELKKAREHWTRSRDLFAEIGVSYMVDQVQWCLDALPEE